MESLIEKAEEEPRTEEEEEEIPAATVEVKETRDEVIGEATKEKKEESAVKEDEKKIDEKPREAPKAEEAKRVTRKEFYACIEDDPYLKHHEHDLNTRQQKFKR